MNDSSPAKRGEPVDHAPRMSSAIVPVIMAGGKGTRLWPMSREAFPKQFLPLAGSATMLQDTVARLEGLDLENLLVVCNEEHRFLAAEQLRQIGEERAAILLEPQARNTAPAITVAALAAIRGGDDPLLLVLAADHVISDVRRFTAAVEGAVALAEEGKLVTFGIVPDHPETGYGYIEQGSPVGAGYVVARFVEKPDRQTAEGYLADGKHLWNSGMFVFRASRFLQEIEALCPEVYRNCAAAMENPVADFDFLRFDATAFARCPDISVDYAVMEKTGDAVVVPLDAGWSDVGSWSALWDISQKDDDGNALFGDVVAVDSSGMLVQAGSRLVATLGVHDLVVAETKDAVLVADRSRVQDVKSIVEKLRSEGRGEHLEHRVVHRPWGHYDCIDFGDRDLIKRITVKPGCKLSVQMHHHRSEHWIVVRGTARILRGEETILLSENEATYIPLGTIHALENPGRIPLELIEVQIGSYLREDDIVRFDDRYGRN